jgi:predicted Zn-dependent protease
MLRVWVVLLCVSLLASAEPDSAAALLQRGQEQHRTGDPTAAAANYQAALALDPRLRGAALGLACLAAEVDDWRAAVGWMAKGLDGIDAPADHLLFYAQAAQRAGEHRLAQVLVDQGLMRFPDSAAFRRLDLDLLVAAERWDEAHRAVLGLLAREPGEVALWRVLAHVAAARGDEPGRRAALEAVVLAAPSADATVALAAARLAADQAGPALAVIAPLADAAEAEPAVLELAARAAAAAGDPGRARAWLGRVAEPARTRGWRLLAARLALEQADLAGADAALAALVAAGETDPRVLLWAGDLADRRGDAPRAEAAWRHAIALEPTGDGDLHLAGLLIRTQRTGEARDLLAARLQRRPGDTSASAMLAALP